MPRCAPHACRLPRRPRLKHADRASTSAVFFAGACHSGLRRGAPSTFESTSSERSAVLLAFCVRWNYETCRKMRFRTASGTICTVRQFKLRDAKQGIGGLDTIGVTARYVVLKTSPALPRLCDSASRTPAARAGDQSWTAPHRWDRIQSACRTWGQPAPRRSKWPGLTAYR